MVDVVGAGQLDPFAVAALSRDRVVVQHAGLKGPDAVGDIIVTLRCYETLINGRGWRRARPPRFWVGGVPGSAAGMSLARARARTSAVDGASCSSCGAPWPMRECGGFVTAQV